LNCYWPWINNYYSELDTGYYNGCPIISRIWIDQNLKKSLGKG
jgi:peptide/nickel transport system substrate-binding protein